MNATNDLSLHHVRSVGAVIRDGYLLYTSNFKRIFRGSWPYALLYALAFAWMTSRIIYDVLPLIVMSHYPSLEVRWTATTGDWILEAVYCLAFVIAALLLAACAVKVCDEHRTTDAIQRPAHWWGLMPNHTIPCLLRPLRSKQYAQCSFFRGLSYFGLLFATVLLTGIITSLLTFFCELPGIIIGVANIKAYAGAAMGDPLGLPDYLNTLTFVAFTIAGFIQAYVHLVTIFPLYYACGTVAQREQLKKKFQ
jgi:hypothetical protein